MGCNGAETDFGHGRIDTNEERDLIRPKDVAFILLVAAIIFALHLSAWHRGQACWIGRARMREPPPPGKTCLIAYPDGRYLYSR